MNGITTNKWNNISTNGTVILTTDLYLGGTLTAITGQISFFSGAHTVYLGGSLVMQAAYQILSGFLGIVINGTGTWTSVSSPAAIQCNMTINTAGTFTLSGTVYFNTGTLTYIAGTVDTTTNSAILFCSAACTLATSGVTWFNLETSGAITMTNAVSATTLTIAGTTTFIGVGFLTTVTNLVTLNFTTTLTIVNSLNVTNATLGMINTVLTINGLFNINISGNLTCNNTSGYTIGTTTIVLTGTGTFSMPSYTSFYGIGSPFTINTAGTITVTGNVAIGGNSATFTYTAGTMIMTGSTFFFMGASSINVSGMSGANSFNNIAFATGTGTVTLLSNVYATGTAYMGNTTANNTVNGFSIFVPNLSSNTPIQGAMTSGFVIGTTTVVLNGTGTWSMTGLTSGTYGFNIEINTTGTVSLVGILAWTTKTLKYTAGTVVTTGSTLNITGSSTLNTGTGIIFNGLNTTAASAITLLNDLYCTTTSSFVGTTSFSGSFRFYCAGFTIPGNITPAGGFLGIVINATGGTISGASTLSTNLTIALTGSVTISGTVRFTTATLTYTSGTVLGTSTPVISFTAASTITCNALFSFPGSFIFVGNQTINGTAGFTINSLTGITAGNTFTFQTLNTYTLSALTLTGTAASNISVVSSSGTTRAIITLIGTTQDVSFVTATRIDSSLGYTVWNYKGTNTSTLNWNPLTSPQGTSKISFM